MAYFRLGFQLTTGLQPQFVFGAAADPNGQDPRSATMWSLLGPAVTYQLGSSTPVTVTESYWHVFGTGLDVNPLQPVPTSGTITEMVHGLPADDSTPAQIFYDRIFTTITGLNIAAADFAAAAMAGTVADLILSGDDLFEGATGVNGHLSFSITLRTGEGNDTVRGWGTGDQIWGEAGDDTIILRDLSTLLPGTSPGSTLDGGLGDDNLTGGGFGDLLTGGEGLDRIFGGKGRDTITGGADRDRIYGGDDDDRVIVTAADIVAGEIMDGGSGIDRLALSADPGLPADIPTDITDAGVTGFEWLEISGDLRLTRGQFAQFQRILFGDAVTFHFADSGLIDLPGGPLWVSGSPLSQITIQAGKGRDIINGRDAADALSTQGRAQDILNAGAGDDVVNGGSGNDTLRGEKGNDALNGDSGDDRLEGGAGADTLDGGSGTDLAAYDSARSGVVITLDTPETGTGDAAGDVLVGIEDLRGSRFADSLTGNRKANRIEGAGGDDTLAGGADADTLDGGDGQDVLTGGSGGDVLRGGAGADTFAFLAATDSPPATADLITDFTLGEDLIDVSAVIAGSFLFNDQDGPHGSTASVWFDMSSGAETVVFFDTGDGGTAEMAIRLTGSLFLVAEDFLL
jgi:Ca2+-binding RTX toxin-like protein